MTSSARYFRFVGPSSIMTSTSLSIRSRSSCAVSSGSFPTSTHSRFSWSRKSSRESPALPSNTSEKRPLRHRGRMPPPFSSGSSIPFNVPSILSCVPLLVISYVSCGAYARMMGPNTIEPNSQWIFIRKSGRLASVASSLGFLRSNCRLPRSIVFTNSCLHIVLDPMCTASCSGVHPADERASRGKSNSSSRSVNSALLDRRATATCKAVLPHGSNVASALSGCSPSIPAALSAAIAS